MLVLSVLHVEDHRGDEHEEAAGGGERRHHGE